MKNYADGPHQTRNSLLVRLVSGIANQGEQKKDILELYDLHPCHGSEILGGGLQVCEEA